MNKTQYIAGSLLVLSALTASVPYHTPLARREKYEPFSTKNGRKKFKPSHRKNQKGRR